MAARCWAFSRRGNTRTRRLSFARATGCCWSPTALPKPATGTKQEFGEEKLAEAALACSKRTSAEMSDALLNQVSAFCDAHFQDDATLLVIAAK